MNNNNLYSVDEIDIKIAQNDEDRNLCKELINRVFRIRQLVAREDCNTISDDDFQKELSGKEKLVYMLYNNKSPEIIIGTVVLTLYSDSIADIRYLAVDLNYQRLGYGERLLQRLERDAKDFGKQKMYLSVVYHPEHPSVKLIDYYKRQGYKFFNERQVEECECNKWFKLHYHNGLKFKYYEKDLL